VADKLGVDLVDAAWGMHEVINEDVARAFRVHASERGIDYRRSSMVVFGGSGPLHGVRVARKLKIPKVICPAGAGVMSAFGLLSSRPAFEVVRSRQIAIDRLAPSDLADICAELEDEAAGVLAAGGVALDAIRFRRRLDMRYSGQGYEVEVDLPDSDPQSLIAALRRLFDEAYAGIFGMTLPGRPIEILNWKIEAYGPLAATHETYRVLQEPETGVALKCSRRAYFPEAGGFVDCPVYDRYALASGDEVSGPALIEERESTCVLGLGDHLTVDPFMNLVIEIR
jgi:N-methylhydantoinase A